MILPALVVKEFQTWLRGRLTFAAFSALVVLTSVLVFVFGLLILAPDASAAPALFSTTATTGGNILVTYRALFLFGAVGLSLLLAAGVVAPTVAASAFAGERERGTMDLLLLQGPGAAWIVLGKVLAALAFSLLVLAVGLPLFAPAWSFGGVPLDQLLAFATVLLAATLLFSTLGVLFGALFQRALPAAVFAQGVALLLLFGTLGLTFGAAALAGTDSLRPILWLNPFLAFLSAGGNATESFARQAPGALRWGLMLHPSTWIPGLLIPAWAISSALWTVLSAIFIVAASVAIDPCHPLRARRSR